MEKQLVELLLGSVAAVTKDRAAVTGQALWRDGKIDAVWQYLGPILEKNVAAKEAIADFLSDPDDEDYQAALRVQIKKRLKQDAVLKQDLKRLLAQSSEASGGVQINQKVKGNNNQVIGQVQGGIVFGNVSGGNVTVGPSTHKTENKTENSPHFPGSKAGAAPEVVKTILVVTANPRGSSQLRLAEEMREIEDSLRGSSQRERFRVVQCPAARTEDLRRALLDHEPYLVHFSGHGVGQGMGQGGAGLGSVEGQRKTSRVPESETQRAEPEGIVLEDVVGQPKLVSAPALAGLFQLFEESMQVVVLNSCYSAVQADEIAKHIPFVVGMRQAIGDRAAIEFSRGFYAGLFAGRAVKDAFNFGVNSIQLEGIPEELTPVLRS